VQDARTSYPSSTDVPKSIPDVDTANSLLTVSGLEGYIRDVNVTLDITHTWTAISTCSDQPSGTRVELFTDVGVSGDNFTNTTLDDEAVTASRPAPRRLQAATGPRASSPTSIARIQRLLAPGNHRRRGP